MRAQRLGDHLRASLWFLPVLCVVVGALLSFGTIAIDRAFGYQAIPSRLVGDPQAVIAILSTVAASMVSLVALVLTITMVVVQLAMGQFSPRIVQRILRDKPSQLAIGLFVATFVHAILALREVTSPADGTGNVPGVAVVTALFLVVVSIAVLVLYVDHIGRSLRVSSLIELVGSDTRRLIERLYPADGPPEARPNGTRVIGAPKSGVITAIDHDQIVREAQRAHCRIELVPAMGEFVPADGALFRVTGLAPGLNEDALHDAISLETERSLNEDVAYGVRMLVDIAERSLAGSPYLDPTTAVQAIDRLHDLLRQLIRRPLGDGRFRDADGEVRLVVPSMSWEAYVHLALDEIRVAGAPSPQVARRLTAMLEDLCAIAPADRLAVVEEQLALLKAGTRRGYEDHHDAVLASRSDGEGIGAAAGPPQ